MQYKIRKATQDDIPFIHQLIYELAEYEKLAHEVKTTVESMIEDGFGDDPLYEVFVATDQDTIIGIALFYYRFSTWKGRCLYLEDLVVTESYRGKGIGKLLMNALVEEARLKKASRILWEVLDWNEPAINFYKKLNATFDPGWINCKLLEDQIYGDDQQ